MLSFDTDVKPLFSSGAVACMARQGVLLVDYAYMSDPAGDDRYEHFSNVRHVLGRLSGDETPRMPPGGPFWTVEKLGLLKRWIDEGAKP